LGDLNVWAAYLIDVGNPATSFGGGTYLGSTAIMYYDFENDTYSVPLGADIGQVIRSGRASYNLFGEPQW
jgi:hypothetical protein